VSEGLIHAFLLDGAGGGRRLDWQGVRSWQVRQGLLWLHLDLNDASARAWIEHESGLQEIAKEALLAEETRPRATTIGDGLVVALRGVNLSRSNTRNFPPLFSLSDRRPDGVTRHAWAAPLTREPRFANRVRGMGIEEVLITARSPWQNPFIERLIGSIRRECLDHVLVINGAHLRRVLGEYLAYYHDLRRHQALDGNARRPREMEPPSQGRIVAEPQVGGLHHRYRRAA
jgi:Mg2+ and Co2+ transporter CorA